MSDELDMSHLALLSTEEDDSMHNTFKIMADARSKQLSIPRTDKFNRKQVINAFQDSFELIGGVPRLAAWAHEHPTEFYKLYSKLLGNHMQVDVDNSGVIKVIHAIAPSPLDAVGAPLPKGDIVDGEFKTEEG
jgi:hypothetical protein